MKPIVLAILDGWGISPVWGGNAIEMSSPKNFNNLWRNYPHLILRSIFGRTDKRILSNSEIGHMMIGSGRDIVSDCQFIDSEIAKPEFYQNPNLLNAIAHANRYNSTLQLIGMVSEGCIHSSLKHLEMILRFCKKNNFNRVAIHAIADGRDVEEVSAGIYIDKLNKLISDLGVGKIASIAGRFYAMDRDNNWDRISAYFKTITGVKTSAKALDSKQIIETAYKNKISDEFIIPTVIYENGFPVSLLKDNDSVVLFNFRSDRMRQLLMAILGYKKFSIFAHSLNNLRVTSILKYHFEEYLTRKVAVIFPELQIKETLSEILSSNHLNQLKIAESDKLAHVTYFLNGGVDEPYQGEERKIIKSAVVKSYDEDPEMRSVEITDTIIDAIKQNKYSVIFVNYANVDEVAHSGDILATSKAVDAVDKSLGKLLKLVEQDQITLIATADHGNGESMVTAEKRYNPETFHTINPVPFILADKRLKLPNNSPNTSRSELLLEIAKSNYSLKDIAPTILEMLRISKPNIMTGVSLLKNLNINNSTNESTN